MPKSRRTPPWLVDCESIPQEDESPTRLSIFIRCVLEDIVPFIDTLPNSAPSSSAQPKPWTYKATKHFSASTAAVESYERVTSATDLEAIKGNCLPSSLVWACRRSVHKDAREPGTACWAEFVRSFRDEHSAVEQQFRPSVLAARIPWTWDCSGVEEFEVCGARWGRFSVQIAEAKHDLVAMLKKRVFAVIQVTAEVVSPKGDGEFIVVSVPTKCFGQSKLAVFSKEKGLVRAAYASVERVKRMSTRATLGDEAEFVIEWIMATTSDARGNLPPWLQTKLVTGVVSKDVNLFMDWITKEREKGARTQ